MTTPEAKPPITCHVLDTTLGRPGTSIPVTLTLHNPPSSLSSNALSWTSTTNSDGRVTSWTPSSPFSAEGLDVVFKQAGDQKYSLTFDTSDYWKGKGVDSFMDEIEVKFVVREGGYKDGRPENDGQGKKQHFHVPVLVGPYGYTTYRGS